MAEKYQNTYRIASARLQTWDYRNRGWYFITICAKNREHYFGEIVNGEMLYTELGNIAMQEWEKTAALRPDMHLELGAFVVMPNHFHALIYIGENEYNTAADRPIRRDAMHRVSTTVAAGNDVASANGPTAGPGSFAPQSKNLASIIRGFKSAVTTHARKNNIPFAWQTRFHDHIVRNANEWQNIQNYITNNPTNWKEDNLYGNY